MEQIAENIWTLRYPLPLLGSNLGRTVTVVRLTSGKLVIHSSAPFTAQDIQAIRGLGEPGWLLDATLFHDTYAKEGCRSFERVAYLAPVGFREVAEVQTRPLSLPPEEWRDQLDVFPLADMPKVREHVMYHRASRTLIVCDLFFHFGPHISTPLRLLVKYIMRLRNGIGMSFFFRLMIKDRAAFIESLRPIVSLDFERIIVGHGDAIERDAKEIFMRELHARRLAPQ
jgi:hypothetical protein